MNNFLNVGTILGVAFGMGAAVLFLFPFLKKKGVNTEDVLKKADETLGAVDGVVAVADKMMPGNPTIGILKLVEKYARIGVSQAEQLFIASQLPADQRNVKSKETIYAALNLLKIQRTPEMDRIIDGAIEAEVLALGHKEPTEAEKQAQLQQAQTQVNKLQTENTQLKQTIETIQNTVQATPPIVTV